MSQTYGCKTHWHTATFSSSFLPRRFLHLVSPSLEAADQSSHMFLYSLKLGSSSYRFGIALASFNTWIFTFPNHIRLLVGLGRFIRVGLSPHHTSSRKAEFLSNFASVYAPAVDLIGLAWFGVVIILHNDNLAAYPL